MGTGSAVYKIILLLHILATVVGLGGVITHGFYNARAFKGAARTAGDVLAATRGVVKYADWAVYAILPLGIVLVSVSDKAYNFADPFVSGGFLVWILLVGAMHGAIRPAVAKLSERAAALPADTVLSTDPEAEAASRRLMLGEAGAELLLVVALVLMVFKP